MDSISLVIVLKFLEFLPSILNIFVDFYIPYMGCLEYLHPAALKSTWTFVHFCGLHRLSHLSCFLFFCCPFPWPFRSVGFPIPLDNARAVRGFNLWCFAVVFWGLGPGKLLRYKDTSCVPAWGEFLSDYFYLQPHQIRCTHQDAFPTIGVCCRSSHPCVIWYFSVTISQLQLTLELCSWRHLLCTNLGSFSRIHPVHSLGRSGTHAPRNLQLKICAAGPHPLVLFSVWVLVLANKCIWGLPVVHTGSCAVAPTLGSVPQGTWVSSLWDI